VQQNDIIILLVVAKAGVIFYALSLFSSLYSLRVFLNAESRREWCVVYLASFLLKRIIHRGDVKDP